MIDIYCPECRKYTGGCPVHCLISARTTFPIPQLVATYRWVWMGTKWELIPSLDIFWPQPQSRQGLSTC